MSFAARWKWGLLAALTMALLSLVPQFDLWLRRGAERQGAYAYAHYDEDVYAAYLNGLILGRPRRSDPLVDNPTGSNGQNGRIDAQSLAATPPESVFSIQFVTPGVLVTLARVFRLNTAQVYIAYSPVLAILATLILFFLLRVITKEDRLSALGAVFVLCFGALAGRDGKMIHLLDGLVWYAGFPFLRRYQPGFGFPLFFVFVFLIWLTATRRDRSGLVAAGGAGIALALLVFSYLFVWTAALAWVVIFVALWLTTQPGERSGFLKRLIVVLIPAITAFGAYGLLISRIASNTQTAQALEGSRTPDLLRVPQVIGVLLLALIFLMISRGRASWRDPPVILATSFAILPLVVFNQQVATGLSLQPFHYEIFIANYVVLVGIVVVFALYRARPLSARAFWCLFLITLAWGTTEIRYSTIRERERNLTRDEFVAVAKRLNELSTDDQGSRAIVFSPETYVVADNIGGYTAHAPLWATHLVLTPSLTPDQRDHRFFSISTTVR